MNIKNILIKSYKKYLMHIISYNNHCFNDKTNPIQKSKVNIYSLISVIYISCFIGLNTILYNKRLVFSGLIVIALIGINYLIFRKKNYTKIYAFSFMSILIVAVCESMLTSSIYGSGMISACIYILLSMIILGCYWGSFFNSFIFISDIIILLFNSRVSWITELSGHDLVIFLRYFATHIVIFIFDFIAISKLYKYHISLEEEKESKKRLFLNIVHDLRTPLTIIRNGVEKCYDEHRDSDSVKFLKSNILKLEKNILNILNLNRINNGIRKNSSLSNLSTITLEVCEQFNANAIAKNIKLSSIVEPEIFGYIAESYFIEILYNLLDNSIKYTNEYGQVSVSLIKDKEFITLSVNDNGIGIEKKKVSRIFESYYQGHEGYESYYGLGLGLALVKEIVVIHEGEVFVDSKKSVGSSFQVRLPAIRDYSSTKEKNRAKSHIIQVPSMNTYCWDLPSYDDKKKNVLICEDDIDVRLLLVTYLKDYFNLIITKNGSEALIECCKDREVDLIITDIMMPYTNGFQFVETLYKTKKFRQIPVIFLTALAEDDQIEKCLSIGAVDFIRKPFSAKELTHKINSLMNLADYKKEFLLTSFNNKLKEYLDGSTIYHGYDISNKQIDEKFKEYSITSKEKLIITEIAKGKSHKEIAYDNKISIHTVKSHTYRIFKKCRVQNSASLINLFYYNTND